jgi:2-deoxy-D-gluconate 3-dehydrogenase
MSTSRQGGLSVDVREGGELARSAFLAAMFGLSGSTAVVTGARRGIGRATALAMADAGADVVLWGRTSRGLDDVAEQIRERGRVATVVVADLTDPGEAGRTAAAIAAEHEVDLLVNNAAANKRAPAAELEFAQWRDVLAVDLDAAFLLAQVFGREMLRRGAGRIVNIVSLLAYQGGNRVAAYAAAKSGLTGLTRAMASEWAGRGVTVNAVAPGYIDTRSTGPLRADPEREPLIRASIPAGRWGSEADVAAAIIYLCSQAAAYVNGHVLVVDGGCLIQ